MSQLPNRIARPQKGAPESIGEPRSSRHPHPLRHPSGRRSPPPQSLPCVRQACGPLPVTDTFVAGEVSADSGSERKPVVDIVIVGASGDVTRRLVVPQLFELWKKHLLDPSSTVIGVAREGFTEEEFRVRMQRALRDFAKLHGSSLELEAFCSQLGYQIAELSGSSLSGLKGRLDQLDQERGLAATRIFDLAIPPSAVPAALRGLEDAQLLTKSSGAPSAPRVIMEKPFGRDAASAHALNELVSEVMSEDQAYRIDHYLGKTGVMLIPALRFLDGTLESMWSREHVEQVEVHAREKVDVGARGSFYEETGALRDMIQSHLQQVLALVAMEKPECLSGDGLRDAKLRALTSLKTLTSEEIGQQVVATRSFWTSDASRAPALKILRAFHFPGL